MGEAKWTPRKRQWPNGRPYWIVMKGRSKVLIGDNGGESRFCDQAVAKHWAKTLNAEDAHTPNKEPSNG